MGTLLSHGTLLGKTRLWGLVAAFFALVALSPTAEALSDSDVSTYRQAFAQLDSNPSNALLTANRAKDQLLANVLKWQILSRSDSPFGFETYVNALNDYPDWPGQAAVRKEAERRLGDSVAPSTVLVFFSKTAPLTFNGLNQYVRALTDSRSTEKATAAIRSFWATGEMTSTEQTDFLSLYRAHLSGDDIKARADNLLWNSQTSQAGSLLPYLSGNAQAIARARLALQGQGNADSAVAALTGDAARDAGVIFDRALWRSRADNIAGTAELLRSTASEGPNPNKWWKLRDDTARQLAERGDGALAYRIASEHGLSASAGVPYTELEWLAGWIALTRRSPSSPTEALSHFSKVYEVGISVNTRAKGAYWAGRAAAAAGQTDKAKQWFKSATQYGNTFYGQLAAIELYGDVTVAAPSDAKVDSGKRAAFAALPSVQAIRQLEAVGERTLAFRYARALLENLTTVQEFTLMAELGAELKRPELSAFAGKIGGRKGFTLGRTAYPLLDSRYKNLADSIGWTFAHAIIWQESGFNPEAKSGAGAEGLMQLMPATARHEEKKMGIGTGNLSNPQHNLSVGTYHMRGLLDRFNNYLPKAIAGYNAGGSRPVQWEARFGVPGCAETEQAAMHQAINWIESIPFGETRDYVKYVLGAEQVYRAITSENGALLTLNTRLKGSCPQVAGN